MRQSISVYVVAMSALLLPVSGCSHKTTSDEASQLLDAAYKAKDYNRLLTLTDSLDRCGDLLSSEADYWRGYVCDRTKRKDEAVAYWKSSLETSAKSDHPDEISVYIKSATRLANIMVLNGDYEGTLEMTQSVVSRLENLQCDTTSDYVNLLIYIGLSQVSTGHSAEEAHHGFLRACEKHRQTINRTHSDEAYKDAIAGLVNIAHYCVMAKKYEAALYYTRSFGELLIEYEQHPGADSAYVDRQVGRFTIYKASALKHMGRQAEADETYRAFLNTQFSKCSEGIRLAKDYL